MRIKAIVKYKGTAYLGWAKQVDTKTVQGTIEGVLSQYFNETISIYGSGRTDAGVHALGQVFHFDIDKEIDLNKALYSLNRMLPDDIELLSFEYVSDSFHARLSAIEKHYQYVLVLDKKNPFQNELATIYPYPFDYEKFGLALGKFEGKHDFKDFTSKEEDDSLFIRNIISISVCRKDNKVTIDFYGDGFMRYMIRFIIGTALAVASNKEDISFIDKHIDSKERNIVSYKADPQGLYLVQVKYNKLS